MVRSAVCASAACDKAGPPASASRVPAKMVETIRMIFLPRFSAIMGGRGRRHKRRLEGGLAFAEQFVDAALQLALLHFALAQPFGEVRAGQFIGLFQIERDANEIVAPPDDLGENGAPLAGDRQP